LFNLANLYGDEGKYTDAEALYRRAMSIDEDTYGPSSPEVGLDLQLIAGVLVKRGKYSSADSLYELAHKMYEDSFGPDHIYTAGILQDLATSLRAQGRYSEAEPLYRRAVAIFERELGPWSPDLAFVLTNLGDLCLAQARYTEAESLLTRSLVISERAFGPDHPATAEVCQSLSKYWRVRGNGEKSVDLAERAFRIMRRSFVDNSYDLPEKDALTFSLLMRNAAENYLSCFRDADSAFLAPASSACDVILQSKGEVSDGIFERQRAVITEADSATAAMADSLRNKRFEISRLFVAGPQGDTTGRYASVLDSLQSETDELESRLAERSRSFKGWAERREVNAGRVAALLPPDVTIVEYLRYGYYSATSNSMTRRYLAVVLDGSGECMIKDLGDAGPIDSLVSDYRGHMLRVSAQRHMPLKEAESQYAQIARALYGAILAPIEVRVLGKAMLLVAPDGDLNLVSFAGLIDGQGRYLVETIPVHYLSAARDLLRLESRDTPGMGLLALGAPDYDAAGVDRLAREEDRELAAVDQSLTRNVQPDCSDFRRMRVAPLPGTRREIRDIVEHWHIHVGEPVVEFLGGLASEENFKAEATGKRAIHLATHGYFLGARCKPRSAEGGQVDTVFIGENPLLLSGLFLAGANARSGAYSDRGSDDGILTACEVSGMDLEGVQMVVLSACETGLGEVKEGEGVYGLRRAFQMAGARTVVSALWPVPDDVTAEMMAGLYSKSDESLAERMRGVQLAEIERLRSQGLSDHPYRWAGFIALGDWR
jgi:CHAT domain-containing protein